MSENTKPRYPGWNLDLRWHRQVQGESRFLYPVGIHANCYGADSEMLSVREVAMMLVMERLSDKPDWHVKVSDDEIADKWRQEAMAWPDDDLWDRIANLPEYVADRPDAEPQRPRNILNRESVNYCILELRHKAEYFKRTGIIPSLDATFNIAKSDALIPSELHTALREAFTRLQTDQATRPDWHPNTNETVQALVHPSMYPLVYGRSRFLEDELVGVDDAVDGWAGKGDVIPRQPEWGEERRKLTRPRFGGVMVGGSDIDENYWSTIYQWLPANVEFTADGGVRFTSYINNLHPTKYRGMYGTIEKLVEAALPMWDQCLAEYREFKLVGPGRRHARIVPADPDDSNDDNWYSELPKETLIQQAKETLAQRASADDYASEGADEDEEDVWMKMREPVQTEPPDFSTSKVNYEVDPAFTLRDKFKDTGLQIIVKLESIELTPEKADFPPGAWHVEGQMNEHIVGTALYYLDSENITNSHLEFRARTSYDQYDNWDLGQDGYYWMQSVYGAILGSIGSPCLQNYGSVATPEGRFLAFPNVFHHRVSGFKLADPSKPGHRRFIALWLVDPSTRIISTANVPPQQAEWWAESAFGSLGKKASSETTAKLVTLPPESAVLLLEKGLGKGNVDQALERGELGEPKLPPEVLEMIRREFGDHLPMTREEAEQHRLGLVTTRTVFGDQAKSNWNSVAYNFC